MNLVARWQGYLKDWLFWNVTGAITLGLLAGRIADPRQNGYAGMIEAAIMVLVLLMVCPMMVTVRLEAFADAARNIKGVGLAILYNFLWAPLFGYVLAATFLDQPDVAFGFLLVMTVPCSSMAVGYTGLTKGNVELATIIVAVSFLLALVSVPFWLGVFAGSFDLPVPYWLLARSMLIVLVLPMIVGTVIRRILVRRLGREGFARVVPVFPAVTMTSMLGSIFLIFFLMATTLLDEWALMLWLMVPNALFMAGTFALVTVLDRFAGLSYADNMAVAFSTTGKNNATAVALATATFSPLVAVPAATLPIFQIVSMIAYMWLAPHLVRWFARSTPSLTGKRLQEEKS